MLQLVSARALGDYIWFVGTAEAQELPQGLPQGVWA